MLAFFAHSVTPRIIIAPPYIIATCRLPIFRVMMGHLRQHVCFLQMILWYYGVAEGFLFFFFSPFIVYIYVHVYLLVVLLLCRCRGLWWLHSVCKAVELVSCHCKPFQVQHFSVALKALYNVFRTEDVMAASGILYGRSRLELSKHYWSPALWITLFLNSFADVIKQPLALYACILSTKV